MSLDLNEDRRGGIAVLRFQNGPQNTLTPKLRAALMDRLADLAADQDVAGIVLTGAGGRFSSGVDLAELSGPVQSPSLMDLTGAVAGCAKPVIAAVEGTVLGGAMDLVLAAHGRVARKNTHVGFPAMAMGMLPMGGATQRLPHVLDAAQALTVLSGAGMYPVTSDLLDGFADQLVDEDPVAAAVKLAEVWVDHPDRWHRARAQRVAASDPIQFQTVLRTAASTLQGAGALAGRKLVDCLEAGFLLPEDAGLAFEAAAAEDCRTSDEARGLRHSYLARRRAGHFPARAEHDPQPIRHLGLIGGSATGCAIAALAAQQGMSVTVFERNDRAVAETQDSIATAVGRIAGRAAPETALSRITVGQSLGALAPSDMVIEAVAENQDTKQQIFTALDGVLSDSCLRITQSGLLSIDALAAGTARPDLMLGLHFHAPALTSPLVQLIPGGATSAQSLVTASGFVRQLGRIGLWCGTHGGSLDAAMMATLREVGWYYILQGVSPYAFDKVLIDYGLSAGVFLALDQQGLDRVSARLAQLHNRDHYPSTFVTLLDLMLQQGRIGRRAGQGFYLWGDDGTPRPDPSLSDLLNDGEAWRPAPDAADILQVVLAAMANQGAKLLGRGQVLRPSDLDAVMVLTQGWAGHTGGPMHGADQIGLFRILQTLKARRDEVPALFDPAPEIADLVKNGRRFAYLNGIGRKRQSIVASVETTPEVVD